MDFSAFVRHSGGGSGSGNITSYVTKKLYNQTWFSNGVAFVIPYEFYSNSGSEGYSISLNIFDGFKLRSGHEYNLSYSYGYNYAINTSSNVKLEIYNSSGALFKTKNLYSVSDGSSYKVNNVDFNFIINDSDLPSEGYTCKLVISSVQSAIDSISGTTDSYFIFSRYVTLTDLDDDSGWFQKIINAITSIPSKISEFFSNLASSIGSFFSDLWENIKDKFDELKQWFKDLGDRIEGFFVDLYNDIVEGLKNLFIPADGYFESKKQELETFCTEHFGALYQAPSVLIDLLRKFTTISPGEPSLYFPAIEFNFQGTHYVLSEARTYSFSWVNDSSHMLYYLYQFYRGFVTVILFISFANYCKDKYMQVFGGANNDT